MNRQRRNEIENVADLQKQLDSRTDLGKFVVQGVDLTGVNGLEQANFRGCILIGCRFKDIDQEQILGKQGASIFPHFDDLPYEPYRKSLYSVAELMKNVSGAGYTGTRDFAIYAHSHRARHHPGGISIREALAQRIHDHAIDDALAEFLEDNESKGVIGIMGGHGTRRSDPVFEKVASLAWKLTRAGYLVITGGGPGVMEAANMGAWFAGHDDRATLASAISELSVADTFNGGHAEGSPAFLGAVREYIDSAGKVIEKYSAAGRQPAVSMAVPTWFYGHEPSNLFSSAVAKYFDNSIREEGLLAIARAGVIYAPGSAGTMQEIFQDLTQNHYATYASRSPMVLFGSQRYQAEYRLIDDFIKAKGMSETYGDMVTLLDDVDQIVDFIGRHPVRCVPRPKPLYEQVDLDQ
ncbi:MAG: LOG family protein [Deltaproteobacteria bacterium]|nr:LOG family protein [Deltaproteobacteria bacterium]